MLTVRGCDLDPALHYDIEHHMRHLPVDGGRLRLGMTAVAMPPAGELLAFTPKRVGRATRHPIALGIQRRADGNHPCVRQNALPRYWAASPTPRSLGSTS